MLGKIMKYEFKATSRLFLPTYAALILFSFLTWIFLKNKGLRNILNGHVFNILMAVFAITVFTVLVLSFVLIIQRFYSNMFKDEGYLTHTLPVGVDTHIWGKMIPGVIWSFISIVLVIVCSLFLSGNLKESIEVFRNLMEEIELSVHVTAPAWLIVVEGLAMLLLGSFALILSLYSAISIGQLFKKHKMFGSIIAFFALNIILSAIFSPIIDLIFDKVIAHSFLTNVTTVTTGVVTSWFGVCAIWTVVYGAVHYLITRFTISKRLNLE